MKQHNTLEKIIVALIRTIEEEFHTNEATFKHNFFYHLKIENPSHVVTVEENLQKIVGINGRADYYLSDRSTKSYKNDVVIEFKNNCLNPKLISHDIKKLEKFQELNRFIAPLFVNTFTKKLDFLEFLKISELFAKSKIYSITICPELDNFYVKHDLEVRKYPLTKTTMITSSARLLEQKIIPETISTVRIPNLGGMTKNINLYPTSTTNAAYGKTWNENRHNEEKPYIKFINPLTIK